MRKIEIRNSIQILVKLFFFFCEPHRYNPPEGYVLRADAALIRCDDVVCGIADLDTCSVLEGLQ